MSRSITDSRLAFHATHFDPASNTVKEFLVLYFHGDRSIELIDETTTKTFLKRSPVPHLATGNFFIGAHIVVFGRLLKVTAYADKVTEQLCARFAESVTLAIAGDDNMRRVGQILDILTQECRFGICKMHLIDYPEGRANATEDRVPLPENNFFTTGSPVLLLNLVRNDALKKANDVQGRLTNAAGSVWIVDPNDAEEVQSLFDLPRRGISAAHATSTIILKPHIINQNTGGTVLQDLLDQGKGDLQVLSLTQLTLSTLTFDHFMEAYKGVLPNFRATVEEMASGAVWAVEIGSSSDEPVEHVRQICGPFDPVIAKKLRPKSLRARMGVNAVQNAVHCCDLPDDAAADAHFLWSV